MARSWWKMSQLLDTLVGMTLRNVLYCPPVFQEADLQLLLGNWLDTSLLLASFPSLTHFPTVLPGFLGPPSKETTHTWMLISEEPKPAQEAFLELLHPYSPITFKKNSLNVNSLDLSSTSPQLIVQPFVSTVLHFVVAITVILIG